MVCGFLFLTIPGMDKNNLQERQETEVLEGFLPDFCNSHNVFLVILMAELLALILSLAPGVDVAQFWTRLALISLFIQWISLSAVLLLCYARRWINQHSTWIIATIAYGIILFITLLFSLLSIELTNILQLKTRPGWEWPFVIRNLIIAAVVTAVALRYFYVQLLWKRNTETEALSRIQALQARIRPHFLFNSMNTIASLTRSQPEQAEQAVEDLADLFRVSLAEKNMLSLNEEVEVTQRYLNIEKHRLGDRLQVDWQIDPEADMTEVIPALTIQPLVENALYHGIEPLTEGGVVTIKLENLPHTIRITIANPLGKISNQRQHKGNRMALNNIRQRLQLAYALEEPLKVEATEDNYTVTFDIPR
ncbi:MAG TPA: sensor histidine kinase [Chromatiales bacterium]|nr:sensor histidine kinase [Thiotrichales bacterium]HIP68394.1 sensor histidine kinase [Chromatiales bacterium]